MSVSYIIFVLVCLAGSVVLQLLIRVEMHGLSDVERWLKFRFKGDMSDVGAIHEWMDKQVDKYQINLVWKSGGWALVVSLYLAGHKLVPFSYSFWTIVIFTLLNVFSALVLNQGRKELKKNFDDYVKKHGDAFLMANLDDRQKIYRMLNNASTHQETQKIIQTLENTGRTDQIPFYLKKLFNSDIFENQLMGLEYLYLVDPPKELELLIFAYQQETNRDYSDVYGSKYSYFHSLIPKKMEYELCLLSRIAFHPLLDKSYFLNWMANNLDHVLIKNIPITPLKLAMTDHPFLVIIGFDRLTQEDIYANAPDLIEASKKLYDISHLTEDCSVIHANVLKLAQDKAINETERKIAECLRALQGARPHQYYCKTCYEKSAVIAFGKYSYAVCPACEKVGALELSVSFPVIVGVIGLKAYETRPESKEIHLPVWDETDRKALNAPIEVLEIRATENLSYDWAVNAVYNTQRNLQPDRRISIRLVGNPPLSQNSLLLLEQLKVGR